MAHAGVVSARVLVSVAVVVALGACSSAKKGGNSSTTTTSSTSVPVSTTTTAPAPSTSSSPASTSSTPTTAANSVRITNFTVSPSSPVQCNAPTEIELKWTALRTTTVELSIDGAKFATYGGGAQDHLEYFACDGKSHTYVLTARSGSATASATQVVTSTAG